MAVINGSRAAVKEPEAETLEQARERLAQERRDAEAFAARYGLEFVDMTHFRIDNDLFRRVPFELMLRYGFIPEAQLDGRLSVVMADPSNVVKIDEMELLLGQPVEVKVGVPSSINEILQKSESAQRVLDEASEDFRIQLVQEDEDGEEVLSIDRITADTSPIIKLVDSTMFNAIQRRASDIHIETRENEVIIKYRIDGVLYQAMEPIDKRHHQTIISRIKVMSELDIAEKRIPQDGRFKLRLVGRTIDFRVSIMPSVHGEDCVIRILDKESMNKEFKNLRLDILGFDEETMRKLRKFIREPYDHPGAGQREEGGHLRPRLEVDPAARPGQGDGGRDPRRGDGADRHPVGPHRPPGVHHGTRQQRGGRDRPLPQHERRPLQLRLGAQLRAGAAPGAQDLRPLPAAGEAGRPGDGGERARSGDVFGLHLLRGAWLHRVQRHGLPRPRRRLRAARPLGSHPGADPGPPARLGDQARGQGRGNDLPARIGAGDGLPGSDHAA
jgi:hypothetical protein